jgi:hypothetical protein
MRITILEASAVTTAGALLAGGLELIAGSSGVSLNGMLLATVHGAVVFLAAALMVHLVYALSLRLRSRSFRLAVASFS